MTPDPSMEAPDPVMLPPMAQVMINYGGRRKANGLAIEGFALALVGLFVPVIPGIAAIVVGLLGIRRTRDPEVGGGQLAKMGITVGAIGFFTSLALLVGLFFLISPSNPGPRPTANRVKCQSNMRQIDQALLLYANDHHGQYPPSLEDLLLKGDITSEVFVCPESDDQMATGPTTQAIAANLSARGHESYICIPNLNSSVSADTILLYEPLTNHSNAGMNVLFGDGHVEFIPSPSAVMITAELKAGFNPPRKGHY
jgi:prepilin-type processing-associated H-X9-DG protein